MSQKTRFSASELYAYLKALVVEETASVALGVAGFILLIATFYVLALSV
jgi:hypothetical protein